MKKDTHFWTLLLMTIVLAGGVVTFLMPLMPAILMGIMVASVLYPYYVRLHRKMSAGWSASLILIGFCFVLVVPFIWITWHGAIKTYQFISDKMSAYSSMGEASNSGMQFLHEKYAALAESYGLKLPPLQKLVESVLRWTGEHVLQATQYTLSQIPDLLLFAFIALLTLFYALIDGHVWPGRVTKYGLLSSSSVNEIVKKFHATCRMVVVSNIITGAVQASIVAVGSFIAGMGDPVVIGFVTFILSFIPMIGAAPFAVVLAIALFIMGEYVGGVIMIITATITGTIDNFIRPLLMSGVEEFHPFLGFISIISGLILFGVPGIFLGPMIASVCISVLPIVWKELTSSGTRSTPSRSK